MELTKLIEKAALANAVLHDGKANEGAVLGRVLAEKPELKKKVLSLADETKIITARINTLSKEKQEELLKAADPNFFEEKEIAKKELPPLAGAKKGKVVLRFEPSPSGPLHIGHTFPLLLNAAYADKYDGKLILRISDTNPSKVLKTAYKMIEEDANWVTGNRIDEVHIQSDRMAAYYECAEQVVAKGAAYICTCEPGKFKFLLEKMTACPCRDLPAEEQIQRWKDMFVRYNPGDAVMRIKTDLQDKNPALRDYPAFRISEEKHPRQGDKYRVWPLMNFAVAVDDHAMGLTHVIRGKDHADNTLRQAYIFDAMGWEKPEYTHTGRIQFEGITISKTKISEGIREGKYSGIDDIQLPTLRAFKRRGICPEAMRRFVIEIGPSKIDKKVAFSEFMKIIYAYNREIIDPAAHRYSFVAEPVKLSISNPPEIKEISIPVSPYSGKLRAVKIGKDVYVSQEDFDNYQGKEIRLKDYCNVKLAKKAEFTSQPNKKIQKVQWVSTGAVKAEILMPDGKTISGLAEPNCKKLKSGEMLQFERFGFCRLDKKTEKKLIFCFAHK